MKLGARIFLCYLTILVICFYYPVNWMEESLRTRYLEGVEDPLVDQANLLAALIAYKIETGRFDPNLLTLALAPLHKRKLDARIYDLLKTDVDMYVYITDAKGKVIFHSADPQQVGADYSRWRDVHLTLKGRYGARSTQSNPAIPESSVLFVAAPIMIENTIFGVLTVAKPVTTVERFLKEAKSKIVNIALLAGLAAVILCLLASIWITVPIIRLKKYADDIREGKRAEPPKLGRDEIGDMGTAFVKMREALEDRKYVEQYVQSLTHEIKSPLSAIRGAAELLEEKMPPEQRARFMANIRNETGRIQNIIDRLLALAELENLKILKKIENISFGALVKAVLESKRPLCAQKRLTVAVNVVDDLMVKGDSFLLYQAITNLLLNAVDFSPAHGRIELALSQADGNLRFTVTDEGPGIPDYACSKVFDKFFSLQRPDSGKKSTGLGLNFVKEIATLHKGTVKLENNADRGAVAILTIPL
ncbi:two-component system sensor histidine kinase CreC [Desulfococcaceae bacterium HSG9]|nr:two-component system sensor histidine kinase CreC [Desulfococcaceae bacterium HSG9]